MLRSVRFIIVLLLSTLLYTAVHAQSLSLDGEWTRYVVENGTVSIAVPATWAAQADGSDRVLAYSEDGLVIISYQASQVDPVATTDQFYNSSCSDAAYAGETSTVREITLIENHPAGGSAACRVVVDQLDGQDRVVLVLYWIRYGEGAVALNVTGVITDVDPAVTAAAISLVDRAAGTLRVDVENLNESTWGWFGSVSQALWINVPADWAAYEVESADALLVQGPEGLGSVSLSAFTVEGEIPELTAYEQSIRDGYLETGELLDMQLVEAPFGYAYRLVGLTPATDQSVVFRQIQYVFLRGNQIFVMIASVDNTAPAESDLLLEWIAASFSLLPVPA